MKNKDINKQILLIYLNQIINKLDNFVGTAEWWQRISQCTIDDGSFYIVRYLFYESFLISMNRFMEHLNISHSKDIKNLQNNPFILWNLDFIFKRHDNLKDIGNELKEFYDHFFKHGYTLTDDFYENNNKKMWEKIFNIPNISDATIQQLEDMKEKFCFIRTPIAKFNDITESQFSNMLEQSNIVTKGEKIKRFFENIKKDVEKWDGLKPEKTRFVINKDKLWLIYNPDIYKE